MYRRLIRHALDLALADTPVVLLHGPRQTGKTTLARSLTAEGAMYLTLDDAAVLDAAVNSPQDFILNLGVESPSAARNGAPSAKPRCAILDEVQLAPGIFRAIKLVVDRSRRPGMFILTGSANIFLLPKISESLAGRIQIVTLWPLAQTEIDNTAVESFVDRAFAGSISAPKNAGARDDLPMRVCRGGFPEVVDRPRARRAEWFSGYVSTIVQRDVRAIADVEAYTALPRMLSLLAARVGGVLNLADIGRSLGLPHTTLRRYFSLLETTFLVRPLPAWTTNRGLRLVKAPKVHFADSGLAAALIGADEEMLRADPSRLGPLLENFVLMELLKHATWSTLPVEAYHFRTAAGREVDIVLEDRAGRIVGIEVKASHEASFDDFAGLRALAEIAGKKFVAGYLLHRGENVIAFGKNLFAAPVSCLWAA